MGRSHRSVRVDEQLLDELEELALGKRVPVTFADQVDAGLRLLVEAAEQAQTRRSAALVAADRERAQETFSLLHRRPQT